MDPNHPAPVTPALAAAVVAWHNRHPFARRISADQVRGLGVVALPFSSADAPALGKVLRAPAVARPARTRAGASPVTSAAAEPVDAAANGLRCAFTEDFIAPLTPRQVAQFALRHGHAQHPGPAGCPQRDVAMAEAAPRTLPVVRFVHSAAIEVGSQRRRVLIGAGPQPPVLGTRLWSRPRLLAAGGGVASLLLACVLLWAAQPDGVDAPPQLANSGTRVAASASGMAAPPGPEAASAPGLPTAGTAAAPPRAELEPAGTEALPPPDIRPQLSSEQRLEARRMSADLRRARAAAVPAAASATGPARVYAVVTPPTRSRAGAQLRIVLMGAPTSAEAGQPRAELMQVRAGWQAVVWPYDSREAAEQTRSLLSDRGIPARVIEF